MIADTSRIVRLDLQENDIKTAGLMALSLALKVNKSMSRLDLDKDTKKEQVCYCYRKVPKFLDIRKLCCNLPEIQTERQNLLIFWLEDAN